MPPARRLWLDGVPQNALDALAAALRMGPLDAHFFLTLESGFHRTALSALMAQGLVDDALPAMLPAVLPKDQRAAWRICLTALLTLPRVDWEVHCVALRSLLTEDVASRNSLFGAMRDALYRPLDQSRDTWNGILDAQRAQGVDDARAVALGLQVHPPAWQRGIARQQLHQWLPALPAAQIERAVAQVAASAAATGDIMDSRAALPALFDLLDLDQCPLINDEQRVVVLATLDQLAGGSAAPLLLTRGGRGDQLGQWLLAVAQRADPAPHPSTGLRRAMVDALLYVASLAPVRPSVVPGGAAASQVSSNAPAVIPGAVPSLIRAPGAACASGAARHGGRSMLATAAGLVGSGLGLAALGWRWAFRDTPTTASAPEQVAHVVALLDEVIDHDGAGSIWQALWHRVHDAPNPDRAALSVEVAELLQANHVAREVIAALASPAPVPAAGEAHRVRRSIATPSLVGHGETVLGAGERSQLDDVSRILVDAAWQAPPPDVEQAPQPPVSPPGLDLALVRSRMLTWVQSMGRNASEQHQRLNTAWRQVVASEHSLVLAFAELPHLDRDLTQLVTADLRRVTGKEVDPTQIYLNTFQTSETWPQWEARQLRPPGATFRNQHRLVPPDRRVRSGLVSAHTLVGAALLPVETDSLYAGLYYRGVPETYFPVQECRELTYRQFAVAVQGRDYLGAFRRRHDACLEEAWHGRPVAGSSRFVTAIGRRLAGTAVLLNAAGQLSDPAAAVVKALVDFPTRFNPAEAGDGRALAQPGWQVDVHAVSADADGQVVPLHGVLLVTAVAGPHPSAPITLLVSTTRTPLIQAFDSTEAAMQQLADEVPHQLSLRVAVNHHARWQNGVLPVRPAYVIEGDFRWALFLQMLELRHAQLRATGLRSSAQLRQAFNSLDAGLASPYLPIPVPVLAAAGELAALDSAGLSARSTAHWLARFPPDTPGALQNAGIDGARWLHALSVGRSLVEHAYPLLVPFVQRRLDDEIMRRYRTAFDSSCCYIVSFKDGRASDQTQSGWVHNRAQKVSVASFADCVMTRAAGFDESPGRLLGLYTSGDSALFDENNEVVGLEASQLLAIARELDVQGDYMRALEQFWQAHATDVLTTLRGGFLYGCAQQHADGSLSSRGAQLALGPFGTMTAAQSQDPGYTPVPRSGMRSGWLQIHGIASTVLHIGDAQGPEALLYFPNDRHRFHEFASDADMMGWVERAAATDIGRKWLETAFDLADLQDGWISNGVHTALGDGAQAMFAHGGAVLPIVGETSRALVARLQQRARRDAQTVMTSPWEAFRRTWMPRMARCQEAMGLISLVLPEILPVVALVSAAELAVGVQQAVGGDTPGQRRDGAGTALSGAFGLALSAPLGTARLAGLAARNGARLQPAIQAPSWERVVDPLDHLAERYARPVTLSGSRAADNGVHDYLGRQYIEQGGHAYEVAFDRAHGTWRLQNPAPGNFYHQPVRLNADGAWEPHSDVGLRGGAPNSGSRRRQQWLERSYRGSLNSLVERSVTRSVDSSSQDFAWGQENWGRVKTPDEADTISLQRMKELFVSGNLDPVQQGALSVIIERLDNTLRAERYIVVNEVVHDSVYIAGGQFIPASQTLLGEGMGMASSGMCTGLSRIMATAMGQGEEVHVLDQLRRAIREPGSAHAGVVRALVRDAQGVALLPGSTSASSLIAIDDLADFLSKVTRSSQFILSGSTHSMACAINVLANGQREYLLYDPNFGLMVFKKLSKFNQWTNNLFGSRYFSRLSARTGRDKADETLAEMYGAVPAAGGGRMQFHLRQVDTARMKDQAAARGWTALFEHVR
ncbi:DUF6543 domain-containing protein [uncultured Stenotrophomonas sp.]|uniref:dermonecrotic toxin domain-containing protein n=1 Tax=uncultured Stenotrophomonas sp. TaxID=165438 RepID=UPI0028E9C5FF|nr:DUF6543 domain-containing protein [uncultured Stenotrophomonas sp.]